MKVFIDVTHSSIHTSHENWRQTKEFHESQGENSSSPSHTIHRMNSKAIDKKFIIIGVYLWINIGIIAALFSIFSFQVFTSL